MKKVFLPSYAILIWLLLSISLQAQNQKKLVSIAENEKKPIEDRLSALNLLEDQSILTYIAKFDKNDIIRLTAADKVTDQKLLIDIVQNSQFWNSSGSALQNISDQNILADVAMNNKFWRTRKAAAVRLSDQNLLADISKNDEHYYVREAAINKLTDQTLLTDIALNAKYKHVREIAIGKLKDQKILGNIAMQDSDDKIRIEAVKAITDRETLVYLTENYNDEFKIEALFQLDDQEGLKKIAKYDKSCYLRQLAVKKITDQKLLIDIAKTDDNWAVRANAVKKITDQNALVDILKSDHSGSLGIAGIGNLDPVKNKDMLISMAKNKRNQVQIEAFYLLGEQDSIAKIARNTNSVSVKIHAIEELDIEKWQDLFAYLAINDFNVEVKEEAFKKITNENLLNEIAKNSKNYWIKKAATDGQPLKSVKFEGTLNKFDLFTPIVLQDEDDIPTGIVVSTYEKYKAINNNEKLQNELDNELGLIAYDQYGRRIGNVLYYRRGIKEAVFLVINPSEVYIIDRGDYIGYPGMKLSSERISDYKFFDHEDDKYIIFNYNGL